MTITDEPQELRSLARLPLTQHVLSTTPREVGITCDLRRGLEQSDHLVVAAPFGTGVQCLPGACLTRLVEHSENAGVAQ